MAIPKVLQAPWAHNTTCMQKSQMQFLALKTGMMPFLMRNWVILILKMLFYQDDELIVPHVGNTTVSNQVLNTFGVFAQYEITFDKLNISAGARFDTYVVKGQ